MEARERDRLADALLATSRALVAIAVRSVSAGVPGVTVVQHRVLVLLDAQGTLSVTALAEALEVDQSNASRHCTRLAHLGLVSRARSAYDRRTVDVTLTAAGRHQVQAVRRARRHEIARVLDRMPDEEAVAAVRAIEQFGLAAQGSISSDDTVPAL
jgi:DNA-binding MarR family transcriptional regulator